MLGGFYLFKINLTLQQQNYYLDQSVSVVEVEMKLASLRRRVMQR